MKEGGSKMGSGCDIWAQHWLMSRESRAKVCSKYAFANLELNYQTKFSAWSQLESSRILMDLWVGSISGYGIGNDPEPNALDSMQNGANDALLFCDA